MLAAYETAAEWRETKASCDHMTKAIQKDSKRNMYTVDAQCVFISFENRANDKVLRPWMGLLLHCHGTILL